MRKELEKRLIDFAVSIIGFCEHFDNKFISNHLSNQLSRSVTGAALNYGEAQSAESKKDFTHKISIVLKELRETNINLKIIIQANLIKDKNLRTQVLDESNQLVSIFHKTVLTSRKNG